MESSHGPINRLCQRMREEDHGLTRLGPDAQELVARVTRVCSSSAAKVSSIRSTGGSWRRPTRDRDALLHAARELVRIAGIKADEANQIQPSRARVSRCALGSARLREREWE